MYSTHVSSFFSANSFCRCSPSCSLAQAHIEMSKGSEGLWSALLVLLYSSQLHSSSHTNVFDTNVLVYRKQTHSAKVSRHCFKQSRRKRGPDERSVSCSFTKIDITSSCLNLPDGSRRVSISSCEEVFEQKKRHVVIKMFAKKSFLSKYLLVNF
jgi:hypothetical protein